MRLFVAFMILPYTALSASYVQPSLDQYAPDADYIIYYDIRGSTVEELIQQMSWLGPVGLDGKKHYGYCEWQESGRMMTVTLPRWAPYEDVDPDLIARWDNFVKNLAKHENGHAKIARANVGAPGIQGLSDAYDAKTNHGVNQGASLYGPMIPYDPIDPFVNEFLPNYKAPIPSLSPRKSVAERFAELNKLKGNNTRQNSVSG